MINIQELFKTQLEKAIPLSKADINTISLLNRYKFIEGDQIVSYCIQEFDNDKAYLSFNLTSLRLAETELIGYESVADLTTDNIIILKKIT